MKQDNLHLSAAQVSEVVERSGFSRLEFAEKVGCGTSQLFKYQKEGLPPRMNPDVHAAIWKLAVKSGVVAQNAELRANLNKISRGRRK